MERVGRFEGAARAFKTAVIAGILEHSAIFLVEAVVSSLKYFSSKSVAAIPPVPYLEDSAEELDEVEKKGMGHYYLLMCHHLHCVCMLLIY